MTRYISVYRCRLCGKEYAEGGTDTGRAAMNGANEAALTASGIEPGRLCMNAPTLFSVHRCDGGSYGVSEFLGFKKVDLEYKMKEIFENLCKEYKKKDAEAAIRELHARQPKMERLYLDGKILPGELQALVMVSNCLEREFIHRQLATGRPLHLNI